MKHCIIIAIALLMASSLFAQQENPTTPLNGIVKKELNKDRRVLPYTPIREADVFLQKRVWRVIDTREKMNQYFRYEKRMFFSIIQDALDEGKITAYATNDREDFSEPMTQDEVNQQLFNTDTITVYDPITGLPTTEIIHNELNPEKIKRFRVKEVWYFDENTASMKVRILGIAPLKEEYDSHGNFLYELPMFWIYYPDARKALAQEEAFNTQNDVANSNWADVFELRKFSSHIYKESNVMNRKVSSYLSGTDMLLESKRIQSSIFNFEHDLWSF